MAMIFSKNTFISVIDGWKIFPENNVVPAEILRKLNKNNFFNTQVKLNRYTVTNTSTDNKPVDNLEAKTDNEKIVSEILNMTVQEAKSLILGDDDENHGLLDIWVLKELQKEDARAGVQKAVEKQIEILYERTEE